MLSCGYLVSEDDGTRTRNHRIDSLVEESPNACGDNGLGESTEASAAPGAARSAELPLVDDAELARLVSLWPTLPEAVRLAIARLIEEAEEATR